ncbi:hypothetical protein GS582_20705, partial [Rhodococcus hoagii]|nr:hypothetical protein [Prescottella equi]
NRCRHRRRTERAELDVPGLLRRRRADCPPAACPVQRAGANLTPAELASITEGGAITVADGGSSSCGDPVPGPGTSGGSGPSSDFGRAVIEAASRWIGTPYVWGGGDQNGPTDGGFDCSGLTLYAIYQASGGRISLPHFTGSNANPGQLNDASGQEVQFSAKQPGDLIFFGPASETHHVGIYYGVKDGQEMLLHAPQSGETVTIAPLSGMSNEQMHVRRFGSSPAVKEIP